jgi:hypothetical protein
VADQLAGIKQEGKTTRDYKVKDLETFDGKKQKLRSWLTAANLQLVNKGVEGEEQKVRFIGGYLRGLPWDWFEAILRESDEKPKKEWSDRTIRILGNYNEFKKALGQVFGDKNERQTAAEKLQRLQQTGSVTNYITEFQVITSSLDWDDEALEDKYMEGLKPEVRKALIYYPTEPENLEELFERTQRIDRELWGQRRGYNDSKSYRYPRNHGYNNRNAQQSYPTDRDGDIRMKGAKVNMEKARKEKLCFNCEKPGHQARNCRRPRQASQGEQKTVTKVKMLRTGRINDHEETTLENPKEDQQASTGITQILGGLTMEDLATDPSNSDESENTLDHEATGIHSWQQRLQKANQAYPRTIGYRGRHRPFGARSARVPGTRPDEGRENERIQLTPRKGAEDEEPRNSTDPESAKEEVTPGYQQAEAED